MVASGETERSGSRPRVAWIVVPLCIFGAAALTFTTRFKSVPRTKHDLRQAIEAHDWKEFSRQLAPISLQVGVMPPEKLAAFMDRYIGNTAKLSVFKTEYVGETAIEAMYAYDRMSGSRRNIPAKIAVFVVPDKSKIPGLPPHPRIKYDYSSTFVMVALHEFPGTERFDPQHWTPQKFPNRSMNCTPAQYLFAIREKKNLEAMEIPTYWDPSSGPETWSRFISSLREGLEYEKWDVEALLKAYKLSDSEAPAKDSRRH